MKADDLLVAIAQNAERLKGRYGSNDAVLDIEARMIGSFYSTYGLLRVAEAIEAHTEELRKQAKRGRR